MEYHDKQALLDLAKLATERFKKSNRAQTFSAFGTSFLVESAALPGALPTRNFSRGYFDKWKNINHEKLHDTLVKKKGSCYLCPIRCKRIVSAESPYKIDPSYGGPEYETLASFGSYLMIDDLSVISKGNELCNRYGLDTISCGASIAFAMECFEEGLLDDINTEGLEIRFGNRDVLHPLIEKIANREGIGRILSEGPEKAAKIIGKGAEKFAIHVKGNPMPAHMARYLSGVGLSYSVNPYGADHLVGSHDTSFFKKPDGSISEGWKEFGVYEALEPDEYSLGKTRAVYMGQMFNSMMDVLGLCLFGFAITGIGLYGPKDIIAIVEATTGWSMSFWEILKLGERKLNLQRQFNAREGFDRSHDILPERMFTELPDGPRMGVSIDRETYQKAQDEYYQIAGLSLDTGMPLPGKLKELHLEWTINYAREEEDK